MWNNNCSISMLKHGGGGVLAGGGYKLASELGNSYTHLKTTIGHTKFVGGFDAQKISEWDVPDRVLQSTMERSNTEQENRIDLQLRLS
ncbi:hypothetical protein TNCV_4614611 [Trichonephila clavipes]|nr:hypothetical protein TNCV_4614611 [Trichonephila clavipes]